MAHSSGSRHPYPRTARVNQILREIISEELVRLSDIDERLGLLTVTGVDTTADLSQAMVFFDSLSDEAQKLHCSRHPHQLISNISRLAG